jgi:uncharacterized membrane protein
MPDKQPGAEDTAPLEHPIENVDQLSDAEKVAALTIGPLPSPEMLAQYENISPGFAHDLVQMVKAQSEHRRALEERSLKLQRQYTIMGQIAGFTTAAFAVAAGAFAAVHGAEVAGAIIGSTPFLTAIAVKLFSRKSSETASSNEDTRGVL